MRRWHIWILGLVLVVAALLTVPTDCRVSVTVGGETVYSEPIATGTAYVVTVQYEGQETPYMIAKRYRKGC